MRALGYAVDDEEHEVGVRCVAAPVRGHRGKVIAFLSISRPATRSHDVLPRLAERVKEAVAQLSAQLGFRG